MNAVGKTGLNRRRLRNVVVPHVEIMRCHYDIKSENQGKEVCSNKKWVIRDRGDKSSKQWPTL